MQHSRPPPWNTSPSFAHRLCSVTFMALLKPPPHFLCFLYSPSVLPTCLDQSSQTHDIGSKCWRWQLLMVLIVLMFWFKCYSNLLDLTFHLHFSAFWAHVLNFWIYRNNIAITKSDKARYPSVLHAHTDCLFSLCINHKLIYKHFILICTTSNGCLKRNSYIKRISNSYIKASWRVVPFCLGMITNTVYSLRSRGKTYGKG